MDISNQDKSVISEAAALRTVYGPNAAKKLAREWHVSEPTAKVWLRGDFPARRRLHLARWLYDKCDWLEEMAAELRRQAEAWDEAARGTDRAEPGEGIGRAGPGRPGARPADRKMTKR